MKKIYFGFGVHMHQPVGNLDFVIEECFEKAYRPFFETLEGFPEIRVNVHISGTLFEWLMSKKPQFLELIKKLVKRGQIEILGGAFYEAVISLITQTDAIQQIKSFSDFLESFFGTRPRGMWLAERVWEPHFPKIIAMSGIEYTLVDNTHFNWAGWMDEKLHGYFITEHEGFPIKVFPILESLRYKIPYLEPEEILLYLRKFSEETGGGISIMMDDLEKFGAWPKSYKHVYERKWLERFFLLLSDEIKIGNLKMFKFSDYIDVYPPDGGVYLPASSYSEMGRWSFPYDTGLIYSPILDEIKALPEEKRQPWMKFVKGGFFRNFLIKYPEANLMHKKMLLLSRAVNQLIDEPDFPEIQKHLFKGQCNCAYWHGIFGGIYMPHLRQGVFHELLECEKKLFEILKKDFEVVEDGGIYPGQNELKVCTKSFCLHFHPEIGGNVSEFSQFCTSYNIGFVLKRRKEIYHTLTGQLSFLERDRNIEVRRNALNYFYDWYERHSFILHFFHQDAKLDDFEKCTYGEQGDFVNQKFIYEIDRQKRLLYLKRDGHVWVDDRFTNIFVEKFFEFLREGVLKFKYRIQNKSEFDVELVPGVEFNLSPVTGPKAVLKMGSNTLLASLKGEFQNETLILIDPFGKFEVEFKCKSKKKIWIFPVKTVVRTEKGPDEIYQGSSITFIEKIKLKPQGFFEDIITVSTRCLI
ncbi:MAG: DUF1926 domain-containing protein [Elusimicrobia bacterium]|nr:DUF1926 domain-containing protein [Elusimicrobiota bacterium]